MPLNERDHTMRTYYDRRALHLDRAYRDAGSPQGWVAAMAGHLRRVVTGRRVLEVACGTGYWTGIAAETAASVLATDASPAMVALTRQNCAGAGNVAVIRVDAYALPCRPGACDAGLAMQWFSHVPRARIGAFLDHFERQLAPGAVIFLGDNQFRENMREMPYEKPGEVDTYELRGLPDGSTYEIIKNYFSREELQAIVAPRAAALEIMGDTHWWWLWYRVRG